MAFETRFSRFELKYMLTKQQQDYIMQLIAPRFTPDKYGVSTIRNIYFDTDNFRLIRRSIEKPIYKEKLRIRSYCQASDNSLVFAELKKKYKHTVYKRRIAVTEQQALEWICNDKKSFEENQISKEIDYFIDYYGEVAPKVLLYYTREAFYSTEHPDLRITFDRDIKSRYVDLSLHSDLWGTPIIDDNKVLMEIKCGGAIPVWLANALSKQGIFRTSFSKYGTAYQNIIYPKFKGEILNARNF